MKTLFLFLVLFMAISVNLQSQQTIAASGGTAVGTGGSVSFTVGQIAYTTYSGSGGTVYQGVQIPFEITVITSQNEFTNINLEIKAFPNPVTDNLVLKLCDYKAVNFKVLLYNTKGELLETVEISGNETYLNMQKYLPSVYFLKVTGGENIIKTFKIVKK